MKNEEKSLIAERFIRALKNKSVKVCLQYPKMCMLVV